MLSIFELLFFFTWNMVLWIIKPWCALLSQIYLRSSHSHLVALSLLPAGPFLWTQKSGSCFSLVASWFFPVLPGDILLNLQILFKLFVLKEASATMSLQEQVLLSRHSHLGKDPQRLDTEAKKKKKKFTSGNLPSLSEERKCPSPTTTACSQGYHIKLLCSVYRDTNIFVA